MSNLQLVYTKLRNDAEFKADFLKDPHNALAKRNMQLTAEELQMIMEQQQKSDDGLLDNRINK